MLIYFILNPKDRTNKNIKNKTKIPQVAAEEHNIVDIPFRKIRPDRRRQSDLKLKRLDLD
jgi:hypothetical protein